MKVNEKYMQRLLQRVDGWNQGVDYLGLSVYGELNFGKNFKLLDSDNSSQLFIEGSLFKYTVCKNSMNKHQSLRILISIDEVAYPIMCITNFDSENGGFIGCNYGIYIVGTLYRFVERGLLPSINVILEDVFDSDDIKEINLSKINRFDYKIDLMYKNTRRIPSINKVLDKRKGINHTERKQNDATRKKYSETKNVVKIMNKIKSGEKINFETIEQQKEGEFITGWSVGKKQTKTLRIRCYDKLLDTISKNKIGLYDDYFEYDSVYRLESEFKTRFCRYDSGDNVLFKDIDYLITKAKSFMGVGTKWKGSYSYKPNNKLVDINIAYTKRFKTSSYNLFKNKISPTRLIVNKMLEEGHHPNELLSILDKEKKNLQKQFESKSFESTVM